MASSGDQNSDPVTAEGDRSRSRSRHWVWIGLSAAALLAAAFVVVPGVWNKILTSLGIILVLDLLSGNLFLWYLLFVRLVLPLTITIALVPFCLIWPGDSGARHWSTV